MNTENAGMRYAGILVPLDGSQLAEYILPHVVSVATTYRSEVTLLHVLGTRETAEEDLTPSQKAARADIASYLRHTSGSLAGKGLNSLWRVSYGSPAHEIVRQTSANETDLVMMSTHGQGARSREETGSVAMAVVSSCTIPVMLIRPPDEVAAR